MFKKTKVRDILILLNQNLSTREIERILSVSKNTVAFLKREFDKCNKDWEDIKAMNDDELYTLFYPHKFTPRNRFAPVDYSYVHKELPKTEVTLSLLWEEYCDKCKENGVKYCCYVTFTTGYKKYVNAKNYTSHVEHKPGITIEVDWAGSTMKYIDPDTGKEVIAYLFVATLLYSQYTYVEARNSVKQADWLECNIHMLEYIEGVPIRIVCDNLKTGVISHPKHGEIILNDSYLSFGEHCQIAIIPAAVKKLKHKASVEGFVDKIADKIIGMLRNEDFHSLEGLNIAIKKILEKLNNKPFQKREGSRRIIFETEEKPVLRPLPLLSFEICEWSYKHKVHPDSHIWFEKGKYSVPNNLIGERVDIKYGSENIYIYHLGKVVATHKRIPKGYKNISRTDSSHLPYPLYIPETIESIKIKASEIEKNTETVVKRLIENAELKYPNASLELFDYKSRELKEEAVKVIASMGFLNQATNIIITGPTGAGKTYLASMLGVEACKQTYRTHYARMSDILTHVKNHRDNLREQVRFRKRLGNYKLLIIDEWLSYKIDEREEKFIYELIEHRCGINSTIFVSQYNSVEMIMNIL